MCFLAYFEGKVVLTEYLIVLQNVLKTACIAIYGTKKIKIWRSVWKVLVHEDLIRMYLLDFYICTFTGEGGYHSKTWSKYVTPNLFLCLYVGRVIIMWETSLILLLRYCSESLHKFNSLFSEPFGIIIQLSLDILLHMAISVNVSWTLVTVNFTFGKKCTRTTLQI